MSYIIFGGIFDPPHQGHLSIAEEAYDKIQPSNFFWVPSGRPPHRKVSGLPGRVRYELLKWWLKPYPYYTVSDIELKDWHRGYTLDTVIKFKEMYTDEKAYLLIGSDEAEKFTDWYHYGEILANVILIIARRGSVIRVQEEVLKKAIVLDNKIVEISSTSIRKSMLAGISSGLYDTGIVNFLKDRGYYYREKQS